MESKINDYAAYLLSKSILENADKFKVLALRNKGDIVDDQKIIFALADLFKGLSVDQCYDISLRFYNRYLYTNEKKVTKAITVLVKHYSNFTKLGTKSFLHRWTLNSCKIGSAMEKQKLTSYLQSLMDENEKLTANTKSHRISDRRGSAQKSSKVSVSMMGSIFDKLHQEANTKKENSQQYEELKQMHELENCTFQPIISKHSNSKQSLGNVYERLYKEPKPDYEQYKLEREAFDLQECTFHPNVSHCSEHNQSTSSVFERLHSEAESKRRYRDERSAILNQVESEETKQCSFKPAINLTSRKGSQTMDGNKDAFDKLYKEREEIKRRQLLREANAQSQVLKNCPFAPQILRNRSQSSKEGRLNPERLYIETKAKMEDKKREMREQEEKMANASKKVGVFDPSVYDKMYKRKDEYEMKKKMLEKKIYQNSGISFTPKTNTIKYKAEDEQYNKGFLERNKLFMESKNSNLKKIANVENSQCTFTPKLNSKVPKKDEKANQKRPTRKALQEKLDIYLNNK